MIINFKKLAASFLTLLIGGMLLNSLLVPVTLAADFTCEAMNNQQDPSLSGKIAVITEEPLGIADKKFTFRCYRQTKCNLHIDADKPNDPGKRQCEVNYVTSSCSNNPSDPAAFNAALKDIKQEFTTCEPVMIYVSQLGTQLLYQYIGQIYRYMAGLGSILAVLFIIVAGVMMASAGDNNDQITKAKALMTKNITGLIVLFLSALILYVINPNFFVI
jgi:type IV secretory pathway VirB2 component (pilin)